MMCYADMTFCPFKDCDNFYHCERALTDEVENDAMAWWGDIDAPIAQYSQRPECFTAWDKIL